jgi:hypothetical protein
MHRWTRASFPLWYALILGLSACEFSDTSVNETRIDRVLIIDQSGKSWDITQAVVRYGFDPKGFKFGLGPFTVTPLMAPPVVAPGDSGYPLDGDAFGVVALSLHNEARAYRLDDLLDVEVVDDIVGGDPVAVVHRPLLGEPSACSRVLDGDTLTMSASGWVYEDESVLFDYETESMWFRLGGDGRLTCIAGNRFESELPAVASTIAPWNTWRASHPATGFMLRP